MKKELVGVVLSDKVPKTRVVRVERLVQHPKYKKVLKKRKKFYAHDDSNLSKNGDQVRIRESRPLSKLKRWVIVDVVKGSNSGL